LLHSTLCHCQHSFV